MVQMERQSKTLTKAAYQKILKMILDQKVPPGERMVCRELSEGLNMSRTPIINALHILESEGFLLSEAYRGFYVRPIDFQEVVERFAIREALEVYAVAHAIPRLNGEDIEDLERNLEKHMSYMPDVYDRRKWERDAEFHLKIAAISRNRSLIKMLRGTFDHINLRFSTVQALDPGRMKIAADSHFKLINRIKRKDVLGSCRLLREHIRDGRDACVECLRSR